MARKITIKTKHKSELIDITTEICEQIIQSGIKDGIAVVYTPHTTAGVLLFENQDPNLARDLLGKIGTLIPSGVKYAHVGTNADAHLKSALVGASISLIIENAKPVLGKWQGVFFVDFDGPRDREILLQIIKQ